MTFVLDTSGYVQMPENDGPSAFIGKVFWEGLDPFTQGYVEELFASVCTPGPGSYSRTMFMPKTERELVEVGFSDLAPETLAAILKDCAARWTQVPHLKGDDNKREEGRAFWHFRNQGIIPAFPPLEPFLRDDGKVYLRTL